MRVTEWRDRLHAGVAGTPGAARRPDGSVLVAIVIHTVVAVICLHAIGSPRYFDWLTRADAPKDAPGEQLRFVEMPSVKPAPQALLPPRPAAATAIIREPTVAPAPATTANPASISSVADTGRTAIGVAGAKGDSSGSGAVVLVPGSADPRIWNVRSSVAPAERSRTAELEGTLARGIRASNDSMAALGIQTVRPDWVATRGGQRFGLDNAVIHLGKAKVPAVLLGLLPIPGFGCMPTMYLPDRPVRDSSGIACMQLENQTVADRTERINEMSAEIRARASGMVASREEISRIAARKDRERGHRLRAGASSPPGSPPPIPPA